MKKKQIILGTAAAVCAAALTVTVCCSRYRRPSVHRFRVGIAVYQADDPYLQSLTDQIMQALPRIRMEPKFCTISLMHPGVPISRTISCIP